MEFECKCGFSCQNDPLAYLKDCKVDGYVEVVNSTVFCERIVYFGNKRLTSCPVLLAMFEEQQKKESKPKRKPSEIEKFNGDSMDAAEL